MKAQEYFDKFETRIIDDMKDDSVNTVLELITDLAEEAVAVCEQRKAQLDKSVVSELKEQNDKWNAICRLFEKKYHGPILKQDMFIRFCKSRIPAISDFL